MSKENKNPQTLTDQDLAKVQGGNWINVFKSVVDNARRGVIVYQVFSGRQITGFKISFQLVEG